MNGKWVEKIKKVEELASQYERHPLCMAYKPKLAKPWQPPSVWRLFPRQALAFNFAKTQKADVHVFALETVIDDTERRLFLVTTYTEFWFYYVKHYKTLAHCYEIIPAETVCKLYFDLEFNISANPGADGQKMVALVIEYFSNKLEECYGLKCSTDCVLNLDSSTKEKFSRHLIFVFQDAAFKDNIHVGNFVKGALQPVFHLIEHKLDVEITCETHISTKDTVEVSNLIPHHGICTAKRNLQQIRKKEYDLSSLIVKDKDGSNRLFIDLGVYTKNRNFRLYKSSKLGKNVPFKVAEDNAFIPKPQKYISAEESLFLSSLVSNVRFSDTMKILICVSPENDKNRSACLDHESKNVPGIIMKGYQFSPYPEIDYFILSIVTRDGFQGGIRQWNYFFSEELLVYDTVNYRWCENIGRSHKSNNVMLLVNLKGEHWYQKCYDPVCRAQNFKSNCYPLPSEICLHFLFKEDDEEFFYSMDENGNIKETKVNVHSHAQEMLSAKKSEDFTSCERDWDSGIDDACILEATEDVELADALDKNMSDLYCEDKEIPDELLLQALNEYDMFMKN
ncbi:DNA-directed primase/polymerase protein [Bombina bombina]|uniref:DNA-directed primase/polymerase protein n=1 Tax=Bombina bombina TaxID=8345 RepID=UPI00235A74C8|nr:DNA-directed primase/polymerase protein [Bombina bombina]